VELAITLLELSIAGNAVMQAHIMSLTAICMNATIMTNVVCAKNLIISPLTVRNSQSFLPPAMS
jgi:hypothetical protein